MQLGRIPRVVSFLIASATTFPCAGLAESPQVKNVVTNPVNGEILAERSEWICVKDKTTGEWKNLIPGVCPQWHPDGKRFFYFLDVGYDGSRAELWQANADGEGRIRLSRSDYFVHEPPVVSEDGQRLAYHYPTCRASGGFRDIVVIDLKQGDAARAKVVLRTKEEVDSSSLRWTGEHQLKMVVNGKGTEIDTSGKGREQLP